MNPNWYTVIAIFAAIAALTIYDRRGEGWFINWLLITYLAGVLTAMGIHWVFG